MQQQRRFLQRGILIGRYLRELQVLSLRRGAAAVALEALVDQLPEEMAAAADFLKPQLL